MDLKSKIILISGPTASGKSLFGIRLAKKINGEIINADSMQVYKQIKILSARPSPKNYQKVRHHLYGFHDVKKNFSTGDWLKLVIKKIDEVKKRKKTPILVGGTGLYFKALTDGLSKIPKIPLKIRNQVRALQQEIGQKKFYQQLLKIDPMSVNKIKPNDTHRSLRAYEIKFYTQKSINSYFQKTKSNFKEIDFYKIYIDFPRQDLIEKIKLRTEQMINSGAVNEVKNFIKLKVKKDKSVNKAIGINEIRQYLKNEKDLYEISQQISIKTRQYAKRQSTWARGNMKTWLRLKPKHLNIFLNKI
jgi:tRNA dimethylallyltransferase